MTKRRAVAISGCVILAIGSVYSLLAVRCLGRASHEPPKPYDTAMYEVYSAVLRDVGGKAVLIQNDTHSWAGLEGAPSIAPDHPASDAKSQAFADYRQRYFRPLAIEPRFQLEKKYGFVSSDRINALLQPTPSNRDSTFCKDYGAYDTFVALSPVGFDPQQTFAVLTINLWRRPCLGDWFSELKTLRKQCGRWKIVNSEFTTISYDRY